MPAIHQKSLVWLILTFSTSPSKTTIQIAIHGELQHPHLLLAGSAKLLGSNMSQSVLSGDIATHRYICACKCKELLSPQQLSSLVIIETVSKAANATCCQEIDTVTCHAGSTRRRLTEAC
jgi:hypothetical protein